jgi:hypothetical protein
LKRFVNIYRLVKVSLSDPEQARFSPGTKHEEYKLAMFLLALVTNWPMLASMFFQGIEVLVQQRAQEAPPAHGHDWPQVPAQVWCKLGEHIEATVKTRPEIAADAEWSRWPQMHTWLALAGEVPRLATDLDTLDRWAARIARYSFTTEPGWLAWSGTAQEKALST